MEGGINLFAYVGNNPVGFNDPWGLDQELAEIKIGKLEYRPIVAVKPAPLYEYDWWGAFFAAFDYFSNCRYERDAWGRSGIPEDQFIAHLAETYSKPPLVLGGTISFIGFPSGPSAIVPSGASGPTPALNGKGFRFTGGKGGNGLHPRVEDVRIMEPTPRYPGGYASYGRGKETLNPYTGRTMNKADPWWHIPLK